MKENRIFRCGAIYVAPFLYFIVMSWFSPVEGYLEPDSNGYINFSSARTIGYPAIIFLSSIFSGDFNDVIFVQLILFSFSCGFLIYAIFISGGGSVFVVLISPVLFLNPVFIYYHYSILTESVFFSFVVLIVSFIILVAKSPLSYVSWAGLGFCIGFSVLVRPVGYSFLPLIPLLFFLVSSIQRVFPFKGLSCGIIACAAVMISGFVAEQKIHGEERTSLLPLVVFAKGALVQAGPVPAGVGDAYAELWLRMEEDVEPVRRLLDDAAEVNIAVDRHLRQNYEVYLQYQYGREMMNELASRYNVDLASLKVNVGAGRIRENIGGYLALTAKNFMDLWGVYATYFGPFVEKGNLFIDQRQPLPFNELKRAIPGKLHPRAISWIFFPLMIFAFITSIVILIFGLLIRFTHQDLRRYLIVPIATSLMINGNFLLISLLGIGVTRYSLSMLVPISIMVLSFIVFISNLLLFQKK